MLDIDIFVKKIKKKSRLMGIDPGRRRIGIAISDENKIVATPYTTIVKKNYTGLVSEIKKIYAEHQIEGIIVGNPINMDGSEGKSSQSASDFCKNLSNNITIPIVMWDERLSSQAAFNLSGDLDINTSRKVEKLDQNAASFILQGAIDYIRR